MANRFRVETNATTVRDFAINRFSGRGILPNTTAATGNLVVGNWVGLDATGTFADGNGNDGI